MEMTEDGEVVTRVGANIASQQQQHIQYSPANGV